MNKRLFIAIPIKPEEPFLRQKAFLIKNLSEEKITWVKENNFHLTLKFIGKTPTKQIPEIVEAINNCVKKSISFPLILERIGIFGSHYQARTIWVGIRENMQLLELQKNIIQELESIGLPIDRQNFVPHFTLARIKKIHHKDHFKRVMEGVEKGFIQETKVNGFVLYESILTPDGPIYKTIKSFNFA